jgi:hypothetical protein
MDGERFSLSPRERAGVRGNGAPDCEPRFRVRVAPSELCQGAACRRMDARFASHPASCLQPYSERGAKSSRRPAAPPTHEPQRRAGARLPHVGGRPWAKRRVDGPSPRFAWLPSMNRPERRCPTCALRRLQRRRLDTRAPVQRSDRELRRLMESLRKGEGKETVNPPSGGKEPECAAESAEAEMAIAPLCPACRVAVRCLARIRALNVTAARRSFPVRRCPGFPARHPDPSRPSGPLRVPGVAARR